MDVPPVVLRSRAMENKVTLIFSNLLGPCALEDNGGLPFCGIIKIRVYSHVSDG